MFLYLTVLIPTGNPPPSDVYWVNNTDHRVESSASSETVSNFRLVFNSWKSNQSVVGTDIIYILGVFRQLILTDLNSFLHTTTQFSWWLVTSRTRKNVDFKYFVRKNEFKSVKISWRKTRAGY